IHALWTLNGLGALDGSDANALAAAKAALKHRSAGVRRAAVMTLPKNEDSLNAILAGKCLEDSDALVRMAALLACSEMPASDNTAHAVFAMLQQPANSDDRWIPDAAIMAAAKNDASFLKAVLASFKPTGTQASATEAKNALPNSSFEDVQDGKPAGWRSVTHSGRGDFALGSVGHSGSHSVKLSSEGG